MTISRLRVFQCNKFEQDLIARHRAGFFMSQNRCEADIMALDGVRGEKRLLSPQKRPFCVANRAGIDVPFGANIG